MEQIVQLLANYGIGIVIIGLFLYDWITSKKKINDTIMQMQEILNSQAKVNDNICESIKVIEIAINEIKAIVDSQKQG